MTRPVTGPARNHDKHVRVAAPYPAACDKVLVGKVADGGACTVDFDCVNGASICDDTTKKCGPAPAQARDAAPADGFAMHPKLRFGSR